MSVPCWMCAYANNQGFDRITHPWMTHVTNNFESIRTPSNLQRPLTMELTAVFLWTTIQVRKWVRRRGWRCRRLRRPARVARGETFSGWRENGALALGLHLCLTGVEVACVARNKVSRWILPPIVLLTAGQPLDISSSLWLSSPKIHGSGSRGWMKGFRCDETKKKPTRFYVNLLSSCSHFPRSEYLRT